MKEIPKLEFGLLDLILKKLLVMDSELPQDNRNITLSNNTNNTDCHASDSLSYKITSEKEEDLLFKIDRVLQI